MLQGFWKVEKSCCVICGRLLINDFLRIETHMDDPWSTIINFRRSFSKVKSQLKSIRKLLLFCSIISVILSCALKNQNPTNFIWFSLLCKIIEYFEWTKGSQFVADSSRVIEIIWSCYFESSSIIVKCIMHWSNGDSQFFVQWRGFTFTDFLRNLRRNKFVKIRKPYKCWHEKF